MLEHAEASEQATATPGVALSASVFRRSRTSMKSFRLSGGAGPGRARLTARLIATGRPRRQNVPCRSTQCDLDTLLGVSP